MNTRNNCRGRIHPTRKQLVVEVGICRGRIYPTRKQLVVEVGY